MTEDFSEMEGMSQAAAKMIVEQAAKAQAARGFFTLVLAGGGTPRRLYEILAEPPIVGQIDWQRFFVFWGDERFLPYSHPDSNYRLAEEHLLPCLSAANIFPMPVTVTDTKIAACQYETTIRTFFKDRHLAEPAFDCVLLGMGPDGHCLSLFPDSPLLAEEKLLVAAINKPAGSPPVPRVTLTLAGIKSCRKIIFMISGVKKQQILAEIKNGETKYPAAQVSCQGDIHWLVVNGIIS